uniref:Major facilitator superfamily (MFS) profile domain-containing protein n=1 Tax=Monopterus albus TaxID=43700 RepID=A0A3Q3JW88_MONAL
MVESSCLKWRSSSILGRMEEEIDKRIGTASVVMRSMYRCVVVKKELSCSQSEQQLTARLIVAYFEDNSINLTKCDSVRPCDLFTLSPCLCLTVLLPQTPQYPWNSQTQGWLLGAFFFGYLFTQIPGGYLAGHYGGRMFLGLGVLGTAVLTLLTPLAAQFGSYWLFALRALEGFGEGVTFPAMMAMWARWAPPLERSRLICLSGSGGNFGAFLALPLTGFICQTLGWPAVFYLYVGMVNATTVEGRACTIRSHLNMEHTGWSVPVLSMMLSVPLWAIIIAKMCSNWAYYTLLTSLPTYMDNILHFDLKSVRRQFIVSLKCISKLTSAFFRRVFSVTVVRKLFTLTGMLLRAAFLMAVSYAGCSHILTVTFLTLSIATGGISGPGVFINQIDIAPRFAGFLLGITNTYGTIPGIVAPIATGYFTKDHTLAGWRKVFWVAAGINVGGALIYTIFGTGKIQPWAITEEERAEAEEKRKRFILATHSQVHKKKRWQV